MVAVQMAQELRDRGHRITFLVNGGSPSEKALKKSDISLLPVSIRGYADLLGMIRIRKCIKETEVDVVHTHYSKDLWVLVPALSMSGKRIPLVLTKHVGTMKPKKDILHRWIYRRVDAVVGISRLIQQNVIQTHPIESEKVRYIPNGVDLRCFDSRVVDRAAVRASLGIPMDVIVLGIAGRLSWWKGYREFLEMARYIVEVRSDVFFLAVGGSTVGEEGEAEEIRDFAQSLNLNGKILFAGFRKDMAHLFSAMDVFVYPAYAEAFGLVLIEAMAMGLPVVSSNCDGVPEIVEDGKTGRLISSRNSKALTEAVLQMLDDSKQLENYGRAGRERVFEVFDFRKVVTRNEELYKKLIKG